MGWDNRGADKCQTSSIVVLCGVVCISAQALPSDLQLCDVCDLTPQVLQIVLLAGCLHRIVVLLLGPAFLLPNRNPTG